MVMVPIVRLLVVTSVFHLGLGWLTPLSMHSAQAAFPGQAHAKTRYTIKVATHKDRVASVKDVNHTPDEHSADNDNINIQPLEQEPSSSAPPMKSLPEGAMVIPYRGSMQIPSPVPRDSGLKITLEKLYYCKYMVRSGDKIRDIAHGFHASMASFAEALGLDLDAPLAPDMELYVPVKHYIVKDKAENVDAVAKKHNLAAAELLTVNKVSGGRFSPGTVVILPILCTGSTTGIIAMTKQKSVATTMSNNAMKQKQVVTTKSPGVNISAASANKSRGLATKNIVNTSHKFIWPIKAMGSKSVMKNSNDGMRIPVPLGTNIYAIGDGVVGYVGNDVESYGNLIIVKHADNFISVYGHSSTSMVRAGDKVRTGQVIALAGTSGNIKTPHVFFSLRRNKEVLDPYVYLRP